MSGAMSGGVMPAALLPLRSSRQRLPRYGLKVLITWRLARRGGAAFGLAVENPCRCQV